MESIVEVDPDDLYDPYVALHFVTRDTSRYDEDGAVRCVDNAAAHELLPQELRNEIEPAGGGLHHRDALPLGLYPLRVRPVP